MFYNTLLLFILYSSVYVKKDNEKAGSKLNIKNTIIMASGPIISWQRKGETVEAVVVD